MGNLLSLGLVNAQGPGDNNETEADRPSPVLQDTQHVTITGGMWNIAGRDFVHAEHNYPREDLEKLLDEMSFVNYRAIQMDTIRKRTPGTAVWFTKTDEYRSWTKTKGAIFWGTGIPGAGKTIIASTVIDSLEKLAEGSDDISIAYIYCRYTDHILVADMLLSMIRQQVERHPRLVSITRPIFDRHHREKTKPSQDELLEILRTISKEFKMNFHCIDGLDEAPIDAQFDLIETFSSIDVNFFITSRPLELLKKSLPDAVFFKIKAQNEDIALLVEQVISKNPRFREIVEAHGIKDEVVSTVVSKSHGMFLHASLHLETLRRSLSLADLRSRMGKFPKGVGHLYADTMKRIGEQPEEDALIAKLVLLWAINAQSSLDLRDLQHALSFSSDTRGFHADQIISESLLVSLCFGLVTVDNGRVVRLIHYTAKDALVPLLEIEYPNPHAIITPICIATLVSCNFPNSTLTTYKEFQQAGKQNPLLAYAYANWGTHAHRCTGLPMIWDQALQFVQGCRSFPYALYSPQISKNAEYQLDHLSSLHVAAIYNFEAFFLPIPPGSLPSQGRSDINLPTAENGMTPLALASQNGNTNITKHLLNAPGIQFDQATKDGWTPLLMASQLGYEKIVEYLLGVSGIQVNQSTEQGFTPLTWASHNGHGNIVKRLLDSGNSDANQATKDGWTALMFASQNGHTRAVELLLDAHNIDVSHVSKDERTALLQASTHGHEAIVELLLGVDGIRVNHAAEHGETALIMAAQEGYANIVRHLLNASGAEVNLALDEGFTALALAAQNGHLKVVELLLGGPGIDINQATKDGYTPLILASQNGHESIVARLLDVPGIQVNQASNDGTTALFQASFMGHDTVVKRLLDVDEIQVSQSRKDGWTPLAMASQEGHANVVDLLLDAPGIEVNQGTYAPLIMASQNGHGSIVKRLLGVSGVQVNQASDDGTTALIQAAYTGQGTVNESRKDDGSALDTAPQQSQTGVVDLLLDVPGIDVNQATKDGYTPLIMASQNGHELVVARLLDVPGIQVNQASNDGTTALFQASFMGHDIVVKRLLDVDDIQVNQARGDTWTPLAMASQEGHANVVDLLLQAPNIAVNQCTKEESTPLMLASQGGHANVVALLLGAPDIDVNSCSSNGGWTALTLASRNGHTKIVELLLNAPDLCVNKPNKGGWTPLSLASQFGHIDVVKLLLEVPGIEVNQVANNGSTALHLASENGHDIILQYLLNLPDIDIRINQAMEHNYTALLLASNNGHEKVVRVLLNVPGIDTGVPDDVGDTALICATRSGHEGIVQQLLDFQACVTGR